MIAWVDTRVWRMLERGAWPTFHDDPSPEEAIKRLIAHAGTLARWAHLGLMRRAFRESESKRSYLGGMSRAERLSMVSAESATSEAREDVQQKLDRLRQGLSPKLKQKIAASYPEKSDRKRIALVLDAKRDEDDAVIEKTMDGTTKENTVQQMRSRARREAAGVFGVGGKLLRVLLIGVFGVALAGLTPEAYAGEQSGGRKGGRLSVEAPAVIIDAVLREDEQSGGR